jgi:molybdate transport system substrate-binding protein
MLLGACVSPSAASPGASASTPGPGSGTAAQNQAPAGQASGVGADGSVNRTAAAGVPATVTQPSAGASGQTPVDVPLSGLSSAAAPSGSITVFVESSLAPTFTTIASQYQGTHPGTTITVTSGAGATLAKAVTGGSAADVFVAGSQDVMSSLVAAQAVSTPVVFAKDFMEIAVPPKNPAKITSLEDLAKRGVKVALCRPTAVCGTTASTVLANAKLAVTPTARPADVAATLATVRLGRVDAGLVFVSDVVAAKDAVLGVEIRSDFNASTSYPIAATTASQNAVLAQSFISYVLSSDSAGPLTEAGLTVP